MPETGAICGWTGNKTILEWIYCRVIGSGDSEAGHHADSGRGGRALGTRYAVRLARHQNNLTVADLGARIGVSARTITSIEKANPGVAIGTMRLARFEDVVEHEAQPGWGLLIGKYLCAQSENIIGRCQAEHVDEELNVLCVAWTSGQCLHR